jgi:hypothetical protein
MSEYTRCSKVVYNSEAFFAVYDSYPISSPGTGLEGASRHVKGREAAVSRSWLCRTPLVSEASSS